MILRHAHQEVDVDMVKSDFLKEQHPCTDRIALPPNQGLEGS
jgi:hypothetical protein